MLYQEYREKLNKRKKLYDSIWKYRLLIISVILFTLAACGALMGIKGVAYDFSIPAQAIYGQEISPSSHCIFGEATFEYRKAGESEWSQNRPVYAGKYECRTVTKSVFGTQRFGKAQEFEILPAEVDVKVYGSAHRAGDDLVFFADMLNGDKLQVDDYTVRRENGNFVVTFKAENISAYSKDGIDVTSSYIFLPKDKTLSVQKRLVTVTLPSDTVEYDGNEHVFAAAQADDGLLPEHKLEVTADAFKDADTYVNAAKTCKIIDETGEDITDIYDVTCVPGTVKISERRIAVGASPADIVYDGEEHVYGEWELIDGSSLAMGQELKISELRAEKEVGSYQNTAKIAVFEGEADVTHNYDIDRRFAPMNILPRPVTVTTRDESVEYSGEEYTFDLIEPSQDTPLVVGHTIKVTSPFRAIYAGVSQNRPQFEVVDGDGNVVTKNYDVSYKLGSVTVNRRPITVATCSYETIYSGKPNVPSADMVIINGDGLLVGQDTFDISYGDTTMTDVTEGGYINKPDIIIRNAAGADVTNNYEIEYELGTIKVEKRQLIGITSSKEFVYNGLEQFSDDFYVEPADETSGLVEGQSILVTKHTTVKNCSQNGTGNLLELKISIDDTGVDTTENYNLILEIGVLTVAQAPLKLATADGEKEYDGQPYFKPEVVPNGLVNNQTYEVKDVVPINTQTDVGICENKFGFTINVFDGEEDTTENYKIDYSDITYGKIEVYKREVKLTTSSDSQVYDSLPHSAANTYGDRLLLGHVVKTEYPSFTDVCDEKNIPVGEIRIFDGEGEDARDVTENYDVSNVEYGTVTITARPIVVRTGSVGVEEKLYYDGTEHGAESCEADDLAHGQNLSLTFTKWTDATETYYENIPETYCILDGDADVTSNYAITFEYGKVVISKRPITIETGSLGDDGDTLVYDGAPHKNESYTLTDLYGGNSLPIGEAKLTFKGFIDADVYENRPDCCILNTSAIAALAENSEDSYGDITSNFEISWKCGKISISKRKLTVTARSEQFAYDATLHAYGADTLKVSGEVAENQEIYILNVPNFIYADEYENAPTIKVRFSDSKEDVPEQDYDIVFEAGTITITRREITVTASTFETFYTGKDLTPATVDRALSDTRVLMGNDRFEIEYTSAPIVDARDEAYENAPLIDIVDDSGTSVISNYAVTQVSGKITVKKRQLTVYAIYGKKFVYNGAEQGAGFVLFRLADDNSEGYGVADGQTFEINNLKGYVDCVANAPFELDTYVRTSDGARVTDNYVITLPKDVETLTILKRELAFEIEGASKVYDGTPLTCDKINEVAGRDGATEGLVSGHEIEYSYQLSDLPSITDVGEDIENKFDFTVTIRDASGVDVTGNYAVESAYANVRCGYLKIMSRRLELTVDSKTFEYDALDHGFLPSDVKISGDGLPESQTLSIEFDSHRDADVYYECCLGYKIMLDALDVTNNYAIEAVIGSVTIERRRVTLTTKGDESIIYDGSEHSLQEYEETNNAMVEGHKVVAAEINKPFYPAYVDAGEYYNTPIDGAWKIVDENGVDVMRNYEIEWIASKIIILKRAMTVQIGSIEAVYDGTTHYNNSFEIVSELNLEDIGQEMTISARGGFFTDDKKNMYMSHTITKKGESKALNKNNYDIKWLDGDINITPRPITVKLKDGVNWNWVYDGACHIKADDIELVARDGYELLANHYLSFSEFDKVTEAGEYKAGEGAFTYKLDILQGFAKQSVLKCFEITDEVSGAPLIISKRFVRIKSESKTFVASRGEAFGAGNVEDIEVMAGERGMLPSHSFAVLGSTKVGEITDKMNEAKSAYIEAGYENNVITDFKITERIDGSDVDRTGNYEIEWEYGRLRVKSPIEVYVSSVTKAYDGKEVSLAESASYKIKTLPYGVSESDVVIRLVGYLKKPGKLTIADMTEDSRAACEINAEGPNRIDFIGQDSVIEITKRQLVIKTDTVVCKKGDEAIYGRDFGYTISGLLVKGDKLSFEINSVLELETESARNTVDMNSIKIISEAGEDVTDCYDVKVNEGMLSWANM